MNGYLRLIILIMPLMVLSACDHYSGRIDDENAPDLALLKGETSQPETFCDHLAVEYYNLARYEQNQTHDFIAAQRYVEKADLSLEGKVVAPERATTQTIPQVYQPELKQARADLITAIKAYPFPENRAALALAQTRYDCWVDQAKESPENPEKLTCKGQFYENMALLTTRAVEPVSVDVITDTEVVY